MALDPLHAFYCRGPYLSLAHNAKIKSGGVCAKCGGVFDLHDLRPHHKIELTLDNVDDPSISLNPELIEVLCEDCHNKEHDRFGHTVGEKHIYLVHGSPRAGKTAYVETVASRHDLIIDLDKLHRAICVCSLHDKPYATKSIAFALRDWLLTEARTATSRRRWRDAYIIGMYPDPFDREAFVRDWGAETVHIDTPREECLRRALMSGEPQAVKEARISWIEQYWKRYRA